MLNDNDLGSYYTYVKVYHLETMLHVAAGRCDMELVKMLLIYGADCTLKRVKTQVRGAFFGEMGSDRYHDEWSGQRRNAAIREFCGREWESGPFQARVIGRLSDFGKGRRCGCSCETRDISIAAIGKRLVS